MTQEAFNKIADSLSELVDQVSELSSNTLTIDFSTDSYNLIAGLHDEQNRIANALERIATVLEKK
jgi:hypothetical protein